MTLGPGQEGLQVRDPKNRVERVVILGPNSTEKSIRLLRRYIKDVRAFPATHPLFCSNRTTRLRYSTVLYHWGKLCRRAELCDERGAPHYTIHQLRHTVATELFEGPSTGDRAAPAGAYGHQDDDGLRRGERRLGARRA